jgi:hypothetical protein
MIINPYTFAPAGDITSNLLDWFKFDEGSGTSAGNSGSSSDALTGGGITAWITGQVGTYAGNIAYGGPKNATSLNLSGDQFIAFWYKHIGSQTNGRAVSFSDTSNVYRLMAVQNHTYSDELSIVSSNGSAYTVSGITAGWHHFMGAYTNGVLSAAYYDNTLMTSTYAASTFGSDPTTGRSIGKKNDNNNVCGLYIDDLRRYTRLLNSADRAALYAYR